MSSNSVPALKITQLNKHYGKTHAVKDFNLEIRPGEILGLLGPNGAGKSTIINMTSGVTRITSGKIEVFGHDNQKDYLRTRRLIGVMHQEIVVDSFFNIETALKLYPGYFGAEDDPAWRSLLLDRLALRPHARKRMMSLSGGMKRRFMVAKALAHKPKLLILDEPTAGVDVELRRTLWEFVREINQQGTTVLLTTHYLEEAEQMCDRIAIVDEGKLITLEKTKDLVEKTDEKKVAFKVTQSLTQLPDALNGFKATLAGDKITVNLDPGQTLNTVLEAFRKSDLAIADIETQKPSLEDIFLGLTSHSSARGGK